jgi:ribosome-associated protein
MLDMREVCTFADYFVICSGDTRRQIEAICDEVHGVLGKEGVALQHREGAKGSGWILMDFGDIIIHIFAPEEREYYQLERLWSRATPLVRIQ